ncbi:hypothetical protein HT136_19565 [Novosphingobium profundi]|uniref:hypothetical protein n=1 Tax=Novosphingobium profundi TaxID=1774954 RepID=UPI001BDB0CB1|nr:hypothetical protein [Novosphingobium profundi]MBT0670570.1 hypothetical protein [Novosphingobium profundi]
MKHLAKVSALVLCVGAQSALGDEALQGASAVSVIGGADTRRPGFAAALAQAPAIRSGEAWRVIPEADAWRALLDADDAALQNARWNYAGSLIGQGQGAEAFGILEVMLQDDPDLALVDNFRLARGAALVLLNRPEDAIEMLVGGGLNRNPEACAWRVRALVAAGRASWAADEVACALPAMPRGRDGAFRRAAGEAALAKGKPDKALSLLAPLSNRDAGASLLRARAYTQIGDYRAARLNLSLAERSGDEPQRIDARLIRLEAQVAAKTISPAKALREVDALRYAWRGDGTEERALRLSYRLNRQLGNLAGALDSGATLFRYYDVARTSPEFVPELRGVFKAALDPKRKLSLEEVGGIYWNYRDLAPSGVEGDMMARNLADALQHAGLYERAADLLSYQLFNRAGDLARAPLSAKVASLYVLAGEPVKALDTLRKSQDPSFPAEMEAPRKQVEAVALSQLGRVQEALAVLDQVAGSAPLRAAIQWKERDWKGYAATTASQLAGMPGKSLDELQQAVVLRQAIALAMIGHESDLANLRRRYGAAFAELPSGPVFDLLTASPVQVDGDSLTKALAALPATNPAGDIGELLERAPRISDATGDGDTPKT